MPTTCYEQVLAHGTTELKFVYTNDSVMVPSFLFYFHERLQEEEENENFMELDLEYTANQQGVVVIQLCFKRHVMVFQWASSDKHYPELMDFLRSGIHFATVDIRNDKLKMRHNFGIEIPADCHIDIQDKFKLEHERTLMAHMAVALIDEDYADMNTKFPRAYFQLKSGRGPHLTVSTLSMQQKMHTYVSYELYCMIRIMNYGQCHLAPAPAPRVWGLFDSNE
uniref:Uncharacterized protein n=1 Tax=Hordeum vulgare subsp. vulgare TaxID=112509 RepID=A0A8I6WKQ4_HORVV